MKQKRSNLIWGTILILFGGVFLLQNLGWLPELAPLIWGSIFAGASVLFLVVYLTSGRHEWGWLFPTFIAAGLATVMFLGEAGFDGQWIGALFMASVAAPFWLVFLTDRQKWWALIPGWVLSVLTAVILLSESASGEILGTLVMLSIALPFWIVYFRNPKQWWAAIPAGIMTTIGIIVLMSGLVESTSWGPRLIAAVLFSGFAAPFAFLWLRRDQYATQWALYPALGLFALGLIVLLVGPHMDWVWAVALILAGSWLLLRSLGRPKLKN